MSYELPWEVHFDIQVVVRILSFHIMNEIATSEAATGKDYVNYWMHVARFRRQ